MEDPDDNSTFSNAASHKGETSPSVIASPLSDGSLASLREMADRARAYAECSQAASTRRAYASDLRHFGAWCAARVLCALPAEPATLALYLASLADDGAAFATLRRRIAAINGAHRDRALESPSAHGEVRKIVNGIARTIGTKQKRKDALGYDLLRRALDTLDFTPRGTRDRAILILGFCGGFRRSELVALDVADLRFERKGLVVTLRRSKTDQTGETRLVPIPQTPVVACCAVRAVKSWIATGRIEGGALFRGMDKGVVEERRISDASIARLVQRVTRAAGIEGDFAGHSLRAGFVTSAAEKRVPDRDIARVTGHRPGKTLSGYVRRANVFDDPALLEIVR